MRFLLPKQDTRALVLGGDKPKHRVFWSAPGIVTIEWSGQVCGEAITDALALALALVGDQPITHLVANTSGVTGYSLDVSGPSRTFVSAFRHRGARAFVGIMPQAFIRRLAGAVARVVDIPFQAFESSAAAEAFLAADGSDGPCSERAGEAE